MRQKVLAFINADKVLFYSEMKIEMKEYLKEFDDECFELYPFQLNVVMKRTDLMNSFTWL